MFPLWLLSAAALCLAILSLRGERSRAAYVIRMLSEQGRDLPPASVIVPVKGPEQGLRENLEALASLDYPDYELIVTARTAEDIPPGALPRRVKVTLAHGVDGEASEKIQNLAAAVRASHKRSLILAFADSDVHVTRRWLRALSAPLSEPDVGAATGYRWFLPAQPRFWSLVRSVWDGSVWGLMGPAGSPFAWGGSMAIRKETFFEARVLERWKNEISDDYTLTRAVTAAGLRIAFAPGALAPCAELAGTRRFFSWARRQTMIARAYDRRLWLSALLAHAIYCAGMAASAAGVFLGSRIALGALAAQLAPGMWKGRRRAALARAALPEYADWFRRYGWVHTALVPLATWIWLATLLASAFGRVIHWRGYRYRLPR